ncbi:hypothetical protein E2C01_060818 [Portunus trituberculatus]|uniref:Uncharacterized protein n=1 Tax=Portunus trituberculatus TaxID=210409 RepID=A0A5B7HBL5_PORTR|nr:hypothetical protein [Portunus trituberculatus]
MSDDAIFTNHITNIVHTGKKLAGWILRTCKIRDSTCMLSLWKSLVVPRVEYCCQLWSPHKV